MDALLDCQEEIILWPSRNEYPLIAQKFDEIGRWKWFSIFSKAIILHHISFSLILIEWLLQIFSQCNCCYRRSSFTNSINRRKTSSRFLSQLQTMVLNSSTSRIFIGYYFPIILHHNLICLPYVHVANFYLGYSHVWSEIHTRIYRLAWKSGWWQCLQKQWSFKNTLWITEYQYK